MSDDPRIYPCADCGTMRNKAEGGTVFTVCDECWDKKHANDPVCAAPNQSACAVKDCRFPTCNLDR